MATDTTTSGRLEDVLAALGAHPILDDAGGGIVSLPRSLSRRRRSQVRHALERATVADARAVFHVSESTRRGERSYEIRYGCSDRAAHPGAAQFAAVVSAIGAIITAPLVAWDMLLVRGHAPHVAGSVPLVAWMFGVHLWVSFFVARAARLPVRAAATSASVPARLATHAVPWILAAGITLAGVVAYPVPVLFDTGAEHVFVVVLRVLLAITFVVLASISHWRVSRCVRAHTAPGAVFAGAHGATLRAATPLWVVAAATVLAPLVAGHLLGS